MAADGSLVYSNNRNNSHTKMDMMIIVTNSCILLLVCCFLTSTRWTVYYFACLPWVRIASSKLVSHVYRMHPSRGEGGLKRSGKSRSQLNLEFTSSLSPSIFTVISHRSIAASEDIQNLRCLKMGDKPFHPLLNHHFPFPIAGQTHFFLYEVACISHYILYMYPHVWLTAIFSYRSIIPGLKWCKSFIFHKSTILMVQSHRFYMSLPYNS